MNPPAHEEPGNPPFKFSVSVYGSRPQSKRPKPQKAIVTPWKGPLCFEQKQKNMSMTRFNRQNTWPSSEWSSSHYHEWVSELSRASTLGHKLRHHTLTGTQSTYQDLHKYSHPKEEQECGYLPVKERTSPFSFLVFFCWKVLCEREDKNTTVHHNPNSFWQSQYPKVVGSQLLWHGIVAKMLLIEVDQLSEIRGARKDWKC